MRQLLRLGGKEMFLLGRIVEAGKKGEGVGELLTSLRGEFPDEKAKPHYPYLDNLMKRGFIINPREKEGQAFRYHATAKGRRVVNLWRVILHIPVALFAFALTAIPLMPLYVTLFGVFILTIEVIFIASLLR